MTTKQTPPSTRELRAEALRALVALHALAPADLVELARMLDQAAEACAAGSRAQPPCTPCLVKREAACLLRAVARLRDLVERDDG